MAMTYLGSGIWWKRRTTCGAIFLVRCPPQSSGRPGAARDGKLRRRNGRGHNAPSKWRSFRWRSRRGRTGAATRNLRPHCKILERGQKTPCLLNSLRNPSSIARAICCSPGEFSAAFFTVRCLVSSNVYFESLDVSALGIRPTGLSRHLQAVKRCGNSWCLHRQIGRSCCRWVGVPTGTQSIKFVDAST